MLRCAAQMVRIAAFAAALWSALPDGAGATGAGQPADPQIDAAPCVAPVAAGDDDRIVAVCGGLIDSDKTPRDERVKALIARAGAYDRKAMIDRAIDDYGAALRLDPTLADIYNARGELWRKKGDRPKAVQDFGTAIKLNPNLAAAKANYRSLALELERLGAVLALNNKPGFNCAVTKRPVEKAICGNPDLATLDRQINAVNARVVARADPGAARTLQREQDDFIAQRDAGFGKPDYDLQKAMRERLDHLVAIGWN